MKIVWKKTWVKKLVSSIVFLLLAIVVQAQLVIVVNSDNPIEDISSIELKRMYLGDLTRFSNGEAVVIAEYEEYSEYFYKYLLGMTPMQFKKQWMNLIFSGQRSSVPKMFYSLKKLNDFILDNKIAIAFISIDEVDKNWKILTIDGIKPDNAAYFFI